MGSSGRTYYPRLTWVVVAFAVFGAIDYFASPLIPEKEPSALIRDPGAFVRQAARHRIAWRTLSEEAFAEARRREAPVILVMGHSWADLGWRIDNELFVVDEVADLLNRNFLPMRIDLTENPELVGAFLPVTRGRPEFRMDPAYQIWILDPAGRMFSWYLPSGREDILHPNQLILALRRARASLASPPGDMRPPGELQDQDTKALLATEAEPDWEGHLRWLTENTDPAHGGWPRNGRQRLEPGAWRLLLALGQREAFERSIRPALLSPIVDWIDGGFFRQADRADWTGVDLAKLAVQNAAMACLLAAAALETGDPGYARLARDTVTTLLDDFPERGWFRPARLPDRGNWDRSARNSFSSRILREEFSRHERERLAHIWGLHLGQNPQMLPFARTWSVVVGTPESEELLAEMRRGRRQTPARYLGGLYLDVNGYTLARLLEAARLLGDRSLVVRLADKLDRFHRFRVGRDDVVPRLDRTASAASSPSAAHYLAFADASLQDFLTFGRRESLEAGRRVLSRAVELFGTEAPGVLAACAPSSMREGPFEAAVPQIVDDLNESLAAQSLRLFHAYGVVLRDRPEGRKFRDLALAGVRRYASAASLAVRGTSSYYLSALTVLEDLHAVTVGPRAPDLAESLARRRPLSLVFAAGGDVRRDLQGLSPGVYVFRRGQRQGPLDVEEAARALELGEALRQARGDGRHALRREGTF